MIANALQFLLETVFHLFVLAALLRFFMQVFRAPIRNPLAQFVNAITDFAVLPARKFIPGWKGFDLASVFIAWLAEVILQTLVIGLRNLPALSAGMHVFPVIALLSVVMIVKWCVYLVICVVFVQAIMSWFSPYHPLSPLLNSLTKPFLDPIRKRMPLVGNVDLSPLVVFVACQLILMLPLRWLELNAAALLTGSLL
ncbi:MAG: YggT family protein [Burkholderiales bacterium]